MHTTKAARLWARRHKNLAFKRARAELRRARRAARVVAVVGSALPGESGLLRRIMLHAAYRMALAVALVLACVSHGCGPVGTPAPETPAEAVARQAVAARLRVALALACRATLPPLDAHPLHTVAWTMACSPDILPAVGVPLSPPPPPASPSEVP